MSCNTRVQYLLNRYRPPFPCTTQADVTQDRQTIHYIDTDRQTDRQTEILLTGRSQSRLICHRINRDMYSLYRMQVPLRKVVNPHSHVQRGEIIRVNQLQKV